MQSHGKTARDQGQQAVVYYPGSTADTVGATHLNNWIKSLGTLRLLMMLTALVCILAAPFADGRAQIHDWRLLPTVIAPSIMMMLVFAIPLDVCMAKIFMSDAPPSEKARLARAVRIELIVMAALVLAWTPFMLKVMDFWPLQ